MARKALLTDSNPEVKKAVEASLQPKGFRIFFESNAGHVINKAKSIYPGVIILGTDLPNGDVYEICRAIKEDPEIRHIPLILLTDEGGGYDVFRAKEFGVDEHLYKPFQGKDLVNKVLALIDIDEDTVTIERTDIDALDAEEGAKALEGKSDQGDLNSMDEDTLDLTDKIESFEADEEAPGFSFEEEGEVSHEQRNKNSTTLEITDMEDISFDGELEESSERMIKELRPEGDFRETPVQSVEFTMEGTSSFRGGLADTHEEKGEAAFGGVLKTLEQDDLAPSIPSVEEEEISSGSHQAGGQEHSLESAHIIERGQGFEPTREDLGLIDPFLEGEIRRRLTNEVHELSQKIFVEIAQPIIVRVARDIALECTKKMAGLHGQPGGRGEVLR